MLSKLLLWVLLHTFSYYQIISIHIAHRSLTEFGQSLPFAFLEWGYSWPSTGESRYGDSSCNRYSQLLKLLNLSSLLPWVLLILLLFSMPKDAIWLHLYTWAVWWLLLTPFLLASVIYTIEIYETVLCAWGEEENKFNVVWRQCVKKLQIWITEADRSRQGLTPLLANQKMFSWGRHTYIWFDKPIASSKNVTTISIFKCDSY